MVIVNVFNPVEKIRYAGQVEERRLARYREYIRSIGHEIESEESDDPSEFGREMDLAELRVLLPQLKTLVERGR